MSTTSDETVILTIHSMLGLRAWAREFTIQEHVQGRHGNALTPAESMTSSGFFIAPEITSTGIKKDRHKEKINQAACLFHCVEPLLVPFGQKVVYAGNPANFEMLPTAMRGNEVVSVWTEVVLSVLVDELHAINISSTLISAET